MAEPEKAVLDYLYLNPQLNTSEDFVELRINGDEFRGQINLKKFNNYLEAFKNKTLTNRANTFLTTMQND